LTGDTGTDAIEQPIDGILDLHTFRAADVGTLIPDYLEACRARGILQVRIIHGKGTGALCRGVHALLRRLPCVVCFRLAGPEAGGWGATLVWLQPAAGQGNPSPAGGTNRGGSQTEAGRDRGP